MNYEHSKLWNDSCVDKNYSTSETEMKGLSEEEFQRQWNERHFFTASNNALFYSVAERILTQEAIDSVLVCILDKIGQLKQSSARQKFKPVPKIAAKARNLLKAQKEVQNVLIPSLEFRPTKQELQYLIGREKELTRQIPKQLEPIRVALDSGSYSEFVAALIAVDRYPQTKETQAVSTFFASVTAEHFRRQGKPDFPFVEKIIRGCFSGEKIRAATLRQRCNEFQKNYPHWLDVAEELYTSCQNFSVKIS